MGFNSGLKALNYAKTSSDIAENTVFVALFNLFIMLKEIITINLKIMKHIDTVNQQNMYCLSYIFGFSPTIFKQIELELFARKK
jgi:hypothetical protein